MASPALQCHHRPLLTAQHDSNSCQDFNVFLFKKIAGTGNMQAMTDSAGLLL
jgi:hypothetical protein